MFGFLRQIKAAADNAVAGVPTLSRLTANVVFPSAGGKRLVMSAIQFIFIYSAEIRTDALGKDDDELGNNPRWPPC